MRSRADGATFGHIPLFYSDGTQTDFRRSLNPAARWSYWDNSTTNTFASLKHSFDSGWKLDLSASHLKQSKEVEYSSAYNGVVDRATGAGVRLLAGVLPSQANTDNANLALSGPFTLFGRQHDLMLGAGYSRGKSRPALRQPGPDRGARLFCVGRLPGAASVLCQAGRPRNHHHRKRAVAGHPSAPHGCTVGDPRRAHELVQAV